MIGLLIALSIKNLQQKESGLIVVLAAILFFFMTIIIDGMLLFLIAMSETLISSGYLAIAILQTAPFIIIPLAIIAASIFGAKMQRASQIKKK